MPGQELLPAVLALIGVNARPEAKTAFVLGERIERFHLRDRRAQPAQLLGREEGDILARLDAAGLIGDLVGRTNEQRMRRMSGGQRQTHLAGMRGRDTAVILIRAGAAVGDPLRDENDVGLGDPLAAPRQRRKLRAVERELTAQTPHQSRLVSASG
jgi:hypothetical protein